MSYGGKFAIPSGGAIPMYSLDILDISPLTTSLLS